MGWAGESSCCRDVLLWNAPGGIGSWAKTTAQPLHSACAPLLLHQVSFQMTLVSLNRTMLGSFLYWLWWSQTWGSGCRGTIWLNACCSTWMGHLWPTSHSVSSLLPPLSSGQEAECSFFTLNYLHRIVTFLNTISVQFHTLIMVPKRANINFIWIHSS